MRSPIRVLVVDDSAFIRTVISDMLASDPRITVVGTAVNGKDALAKLSALKPDVMTLDIEMPVMNGLDVLRQVMVNAPLPILMVSSLTDEGAKQTLMALDLGAVDYIPKNLQGSAMNIVAIKRNLVEKVVMAYEAGPKLAQFARQPSSERPVVAGHTRTGNSGTGKKIVAIGCSTGGPRALQEILPRFPKDFPAAILVVQHMPKSFTGTFAERLNELSQIEVREALEGDVVKPGVALIAPGGVHLTLSRRNESEIEVALSSNPVTLHIPSVDIMMTSAAAVFKERTLGVILTGMGHDGLDGMKAIKTSHGRTIAQDEASCVVYGMPKSVVDSGIADKVVPLHKIADEIASMV
jgi:two-component system chemotaxis response regulator CheB